MGIVNRRNAVLGWTAWQLGKRIAKRKAKAAVPGVDSETKRPNKSAILALVGAVVGAILVWRKRSDDEVTPPPPPPVA